ncbi:stearoyl-CoA desaturase 5 isoform X1 [Rhipicephalus microplus]|uniref:stearoyl-CoA desaturase 5 isoform X1 n=2 Tax=Rhipicephalus microplus TaxID=6941 RepID=UPI0018871A88|nr:stearoyl-CoA desaturase 5-like isoform X1 [Rhipicephalus microplus]
MVEWSAMNNDIKMEKTAATTPADMLSLNGKTGLRKRDLDLIDAMDLIKQTEYVSLSKSELLDHEIITSPSTTVQEQQAVQKEADKAVQPAFKTEVVWRNVAVFALLHSMALYGLYLSITSKVKWQTAVFSVTWGVCAGLGVTAGAHRLWSHRSYKARFPLRVVLMIFNCMACQNDLYEWTRDHRVHHKFSESNADPHNVNRGFFFAHVGWLMCKKHPDVMRKGKAVDCSDLLKDPVIRFQKAYYVPLTTFFCFYLSTVLPHHLFGESYWVGFFVATMLRYVISLNFTWLVNSAAHLWGNRPYDKNISPAENRFVSWAAIGEGFHNYHHTFPWDYSTSELGWKLNFTTFFIDTMAKLGLAYDLKTVPKDVVEKRKARTGDHSYDYMNGHKQHH